MATFWREGQWRGSSWVEGHWVTRDDFSKTSSGHDNSQNYNYILETYESVTIPNVKCKCCGDEIFFYQSPYGGKVFFNELGHPWEKHCCEPQCCGKEIGNISYEILDKSRIRNLRKEPIWKQEGWTPAIYIQKKHYNNIKKIILRAVEDGKEYTFFISIRSFFPLKNREGLFVNFKPIDTNIFEISFYNDKKYRIKGSVSPNAEFLLKNKQTNILKKKTNLKHNKKNQKEKRDKVNLRANQDDKKTLNRISLVKNQEKVNINKSQKSKKNKSASKNKKVNSNPKKNQEKQNVVKKKRDKSNLRANRDSWKGVSVYKGKSKIRTFLEKDSK